MLSISLIQVRKNSRTYFTRMRVNAVAALMFLAVLFLGTVDPIHAASRAKITKQTQESGKHISLPTPRSHYDTYKPGTSGLPLLIQLLSDSDPRIQPLLLKFSLASGFQGIPSGAEIDSADLKQIQSLAAAAGITRDSVIPKAEIIVLIKQTNWQAQKPLLLEFFLHQSRVLEMIPEKWGAIWAPIVHDAMLYFLDNLSDDRLLDKMVSLALLPPGTSRGDYLKEFVSKVPSLQKMGQILARNPDLSPDYQKSLQDLESGIRTMSGEEMVQFITADIGKPQIDKYQMQFADKLFGEASVGATILATGITPGSTTRRQMVVKIVKPYVLVYLPEDLAIIDGLAAYFTTNHDFYELGSMPLVDIFKEIRRSLTNEINIVAEQKNFIRAREYYKGSKKVVVPEIYPISTNHVTVMEFIVGEKITSAFPGDNKQRSIMARQLSNVMTGDVIFSKQPEAIFHGDPHPGNVYHFTGDPTNPYKIALIDWGLMGTFPREDRKALVQLILGVQLSDAKRLHNNVGALVEGGIPNDPAKWQKVDALIAEVLQPKPGEGSFDGLQNLLFGLIQQGYATKFNLNIFIKSQATIAGELVQLDPNLKQDDLIEKQVTSLVKKEMPKRLVCVLFCWNSRNYTSMLSNGDLKAVLSYKKPKQGQVPAKVASQPKVQTQP